MSITPCTFTKAGQAAVSTQRVAHFFDETRMQLPSPLNEKHHLLFQIHDINIDDGAEVRSHFGFIKPYDNDVVDDRDDTTPIILEMDENYLSESDHFDTKRLYINANCVFSRQSTRTIGLHTAAAQQDDHR